MTGMLEGVSEGSVTSGASVRLCFLLAWQSGTAWPGGGGGCAVMIYGPGRFMRSAHALERVAHRCRQHAHRISPAGAAVVPWLLPGGSTSATWPALRCVGRCRAMADESAEVVRSVGLELVSRLAPEELPLYPSLVSQFQGAKRGRGVKRHRMISSLASGPPKP